MPFSRQSKFYDTRRLGYYFDVSLFHWDPVEEEERTPRRLICLPFCGGRIKAKLNDPVVMAIVTMGLRNEAAVVGPSTGEVFCILCRLGM